MDVKPIIAMVCVNQSNFSPEKLPAGSGPAAPVTVSSTPRPPNHISTQDNCELCHSLYTFEPIVHMDHLAARGTCFSCHNNLVAIGQDPSGFYQEQGYYDIDDLGVWKRALTSLEVGAIYLAGTNANSSYFDFAPIVTLCPAVSVLALLMSILSAMA